MGQWIEKAGAIFYILWGVLHIFAAYLSFELAGQQPFGAVQSKIYQNGWNLAYVSVFAIAIAALFNWRNSVVGYWLNLITISVVDIGFLVLIYAPGHNTDLLGPMLWIAGAVLTTVDQIANFLAALRRDRLRR